MKKSLFRAFIISLNLICVSLYASTNMIGGGALPSDSPILKSTVSLVMEYQGKLTSFCTGSVISTSIILTAAHCVDGYTDGPLYVSHGVEALKGKMYPVKYAKFYSKGFYTDTLDVHDLETRDIAILILEDEIPLVPIKIGSPELLTAKTPLTQVGYGFTSKMCDDGYCGSDDLGKLLMLKSGKFSHTNATAVYVKESASFRVGGGDSGGPLITISHSNYLLNGILSQSMEDYFDFYALYTHPYYFISWINCSIPSKQRINYQGTLNDQVACDEVPLLKVSELKTFKHKLCEDNLKGFKFVNNDCLPATKEACEKYSANIEPQMQWDAYTGKCL